MLEYSELRDLLSQGKILKSVRENYVSYELITMYDGMPILTNVQRSLTYSPTSVNWTSEETLKLIYKQSQAIKSNIEFVIDCDEIDLILRLVRKVTHSEHNQPHVRNYAFFAMDKDFPVVHNFDLSNMQASDILN